MAVAPEGVHQVRRPFDVGGRRLAVGEFVDVTGWHNAYQLVDRGYLVDPSNPRYRMIRTSPGVVAESPREEPSAPSEMVSEDVTVAAGLCDKCGATGSEPCRSKTGKIAPRHAGRKS